VSTQLPKPAKVKVLTIIKNHIKDKVGKMAQSITKRISKAMPSRWRKSRKNQKKFAKRIADNNKVLEKAKNQLS
jgi:ABC-type Zn2+ transport system substrate-binding protein/surface adhesin